MRFLTPLRLAVLITVLSYLVLNSLVVLNGNRHREALSKFDLNQDGFFTDNEITEQQQKALRNVSSDTSRTFAPFTLIPVSILIGYVTYRIRKRNLEKVQ